ncbi:hypothetical protein [Phaeobacter sp. 22II1-1F12B]|uniref:hypothetical protein n=1 Tax=Phaeobacter sp. 22II1-1F12B TaxID=1317111 RepID=UPI0013038B8A|nr:hypothetical protein [Phaeobacter sp. 22II1-1F12B]
MIIGFAEIHQRLRQRGFEYALFYREENEQPPKDQAKENRRNTNPKKPLQASPET